MAHVLISFLGKTQQGAYDSVIYDFRDAKHYKSAIFPYVLCKQLHPDKLLLLGTTGSMWDALQFDIIGGAPLNSTDRGFFSTVKTAAKNDQIDECRLNELSDILSLHLSVECICRLIPYGRDLDEQVRILEVMADHAEEGDRVSLDITHGFRHLPMLAQLSALYLRDARKAEIAGIYYGARDMAEKDRTGNEIAPVIDLRGLLHIADWSAALHAYDKDGDYGVFADLLEQEGMGRHIARLREAAFLERTNRPRGAHKKLSLFLKGVKGEDAEKRKGIIGLFWPTLMSRLGWYGETLASSRQVKLARINLEHHDFVRSVIFAFEGFVTRLMEEQGKMDKVDIYRERDKTKRVYEGRNEHCSPPDTAFEGYKQLRSLRNNLAHTYTDEKQEDSSELANAESLSKSMEALLNGLFSGEPK